MIDVHIHLQDEPGYLDRLLEAAKGLGYAGVCLSATGRHHNQVGNDEVIQAARAHPEIIFPLAWTLLDKRTPEDIERFKEQGFFGLKVIDPEEDYDSDRYYPLYEKAQELRMPILFHTGLKARFPVEKRTVSRARHMKPLHLDAIARYFPGLNLVMAHLGGPWYEEAFMVSRVNPNIYLDLSSGSGWMVKGMGPGYFRGKLWWEGAWKKLVFGSDVHYDRLSWAVDVYRDILDGCEVSAEDRGAIWSGNMRRMLGL